MLRAKGDFAAALKEYEARRAIGERLVAADPGNAVWQRDLSVAHRRVGDTLQGQRKLNEALLPREPRHCPAAGCRRSQQCQVAG
jgi:hypothetical protein